MRRIAVKRENLCFLLQSIIKRIYFSFDATEKSAPKKDTRKECSFYASHKVRFVLV